MCASQKSWNDLREGLKQNFLIFGDIMQFQCAVLEILADEVIPLQPLSKLDANIRDVILLH